MLLFFICTNIFIFLTLTYKKTLQALLACPPFYTLLQNLPLSQGLERGKSATPVTDSM